MRNTLSSIGKNTEGDGKPATVADLAEHPAQEYLVATSKSDDYKLLKIRSSGEVSLTEHGLVVCKHCLHALRYRDYDEFRNRRRGYSQKGVDDFNLKDFYRFYQQ